MRLKNLSPVLLLFSGQALLCAAQHDGLNNVTHGDELTFSGLFVENTTPASAVDELPTPAPSSFGRLGCFIKSAGDKVLPTVVKRAVRWKKWTGETTKFDRAMYRQPPYVPT